MRLEERIELVPQQKPRTEGVTIAIAVSVIVHVLLMVYFVRNYQPISGNVASSPMVRYVELMRQNPQNFVEAPGPKVDSAPITAPLSDANRKASMPEPTGDKPTTRPGDGSGLWTPPARQAVATPASPAAQQQQPQQAQQGSERTQAEQQREQAAVASGFVYRERGATAAASAAVDWRDAIREVGKVASLGGQQGLDLSGVGGGGEKGFAESGPLSFETQWYDWGEYAASMVSRIRVNWYANMPQLIQTGMKGVVVIRFTIQRSGAITNVTLLDGSGIPPYDFAAKKAIELSTPLNPLPKDFPSSSERVTCAFYYNQEPPRDSR